MSQYLFRRILYAFPLLLGVNILTFILFFVVNSPDDMARMQLGQKRVSPEAIEKWKHERGYDLPLLWNEAGDSVQRATETIFFQKSMGLFLFRFGRSDQGRDIGADIGQRMWPSLAIAAPSLVFGVLVNITLALLLVLFRLTYLEFWGVAL
jgi:peptide/nickel transport system permease protein